MTLPSSDLQAHGHDVLRIFLASVGDGYYHLRIPVADERFKDVPQTVWKTLENKGLLEPKHDFGNPTYQLSASGWLRALELDGELVEQTKTFQRAVKLVSLLKDRVKGRENAHIGELFEPQWGLPDPDLPSGWVHNALVSGLLDRLWPGRNYSVSHYPGKRAFRIPATFGQREFDI